MELEDNDQWNLLYSLRPSYVTIRTCAWRRKSPTRSKNRKIQKKGSNVIEILTLTKFITLSQQQISYFFSTTQSFFHVFVVGNLRLLVEGSFCCCCCDFSASSRGDCSHRSFGLDSTIFCNRSNHRKWSMYTLLFR